MNDHYRYFLVGHDRELVDHEHSCDHRRDAPLFHVYPTKNGIALTLRCPRSLTPGERKKLIEEKK